MKKAKIIAFHSPKTAGATLISFNAAVAWQLANPQQKTMFAEFSLYPDIQNYLGISPQNTIKDILAFKGAEGDFTADILSNIVWENHVTGVSSPEGRIEWAGISPADLQFVLDRLSAFFDTIFLDISHLETAHYGAILPLVDHLICLMTLDNVSINRQRVFLHDMKQLGPLPKTSLLINQVPKDATGWVKKWENQLSLPVMGTLPMDTKAIWQSVFQKTSFAVNGAHELTKALNKILCRL